LIDIKELNGKYKVTFASNTSEINPDTFDISGVILTVENGEFSGVDDANIKWSGTLTIAQPNETANILAKLRLDPRRTPPGIFVHSPNGQQTRDIVEHDVPLKVMKLLQTITMRGTIHFGPVSIEITVRQL
jgi:hypothetical protein